MPLTIVREQKQTKGQRTEQGWATSKSLHQFLHVSSVCGSGLSKDLKSPLKQQKKQCGHKKKFPTKHSICPSASKCIMQMVCFPPCCYNSCMLCSSLFNLPCASSDMLPCRDRFSSNKTGFSVLSKSLSKELMTQSSRTTSSSKARINQSVANLPRMEAAKMSCN